MNESERMAARRLKPVLIYGPTASGKSALAIATAQRLQDACGARARIVNADALQVYSGWRILTARPGAADLAVAEHALYGHIDPAEPNYSAGRWLREAALLLEDADRCGDPVIFVGGTGLYFKLLTQGLAPIPAIPAETRAAIEAEIADLGVEAAAARLRREDPDSAAQVDLRNPRRVLRALEVLKTTGRGLAAWARETPPPLLPLEAAATARIVIDRALLRRRIATRLNAMAQEGALEEVAAMLARIDSGELHWRLPAMQALGASEFAAHLQEDLPLEEAIAAAALETGRYAKRQDSWGRNQCAQWRAFDWNLSPKDAVEPTAEALAHAARQDGE